MRNCTIYSSSHRPLTWSEWQCVYISSSIARTSSLMSCERVSGGVSMSMVCEPRIITPQSPRRAAGLLRASSHAGQSQKNAGTPQPAPVPIKVKKCLVIGAPYGFFVIIPLALPLRLIYPFSGASSVSALVFSL